MGTFNLESFPHHFHCAQVLLYLFSNIGLKKSELWEMLSWPKGEKEVFLWRKDF
jgi:hypothetical protein